MRLDVSLLIPLLWLLDPMLLVAENHALPVEQNIVHEEFLNLDSWEPIYLKNVDRHSSYTVVDSSGAGGGKVLRAIADNSASGLGHKTRIKVREYPHLRWRWKIANIFPKAEGDKKSGDDYAFRLQVCFFYESKKSSLFGSVKRLVAEAAYGEDLPYRVLQYVWANQSAEKVIFKNPYTSDVAMVPVRSGASQLGSWQIEARNILKDYKEAFGEEPPAEARLAIMADGDNAGGKSEAWIDWVQVSSKEQSVKDSRQ
jgi:hypothetical protein